MRKLPHPLILLLGGVAIAAALTWIVPAGAFDRRDDPATNRRVAIAGTYHALPRTPVGPFAAAVSVPRGFVAAAEVIAVVLFVGGAWVVVDRLGTLPALVDVIVGRFGRRGLWAIPVVSIFFAVMGALENMQEEIIPLVPVLLVLGSGLGVDAIVVVAMSAGAAMIGSAFGPTNPFQAGIALKLAQLSPVAGGALRLAMFVAALAIWIAWTLRYALRNRVTPASTPRPADGARLPAKHAFVLAIALAPMAAYVYGALRLDWGFNELSGAFVLAALAAGLVGGMGLTTTVATFLDGAAALIPAAILIGAARSISLVLEDGRIVDTILPGARVAAGRGAARPRGAAADSGSFPRSPRRAERQRTGGVDDAAVRAAGGPARPVAAGACPRLSDRRRSQRADLADQRRADGRTARGRRPLSALDPLRCRGRAAGGSRRCGCHRDRHVDLVKRFGFDRLERREITWLAVGVCACALLLLFLLLAGEVAAGDTLAFDTRILRSLRDAADPSRPVGPAWIESVLFDLTALGSPVILALVVLAVVGFLLLQGRRRTAFAIAVTSFGGELVDSAMKHAFNRPRPTVVPPLREVFSTSFPSGHAMESAIVYVTVGAVLMRVAEGRLTKLYCLGIAVLLSALAGISRVWLGVHYPTDVLGGWMIGFVWASICWLATEHFEARAGIDAEKDRR